MVTWQNWKVQTSWVGALEGCSFFFAGTNLVSRGQYDCEQRTKVCDIVWVFFSSYYYSSFAWE